MVWEAQTCHRWLPKAWGCSHRRGPTALQTSPAARDASPNPAAEVTAALSYQIEQIFLHLPWSLVLIRWAGKRKETTHFLLDLSFSHLWPKEKVLDQESLSYDIRSHLLSTSCVTSGY